MKKQITIIGRRWFNNTQGNTYHISEVYVNKKFISESKITYGYEDHYIQTGLKLLQENNLYSKNKNYFDFLNDIRDNKFNLITEVSNVSRRKDL